MSRTAGRASSRAISAERFGSRSRDARNARKKGACKTATGHPEAAALADEAPVQVRVELGRIRMTVAELAELSPGTILELRKDPEQPVTLLSEDRVVARGEIVRIEGELGVRILSLH